MCMGLCVCVVRRHNSLGIAKFMRCLSHELYLDYVVLESLMQNPRIEIILMHIVYVLYIYI